MILALLLACPADKPDPTNPDTVPVVTDSGDLTLTVGAHDERVTELDGSVVLTVAEAVTVTCTADADATEVFTIELPADGEPPLVLSFALYGLAPGTAYTCVGTTASGLGASAPVTTGVWTDAPELTQEGDAAAIDGAYTVFNVGDLCRGDGTNTVWIADPEGRLRWRWRVPEDGVPDIDVSWLGDRFLIGGGAGIYGIGDGGIREVDLAGTVLYERMTPASGVDYNHHVERLDDGSDLAVVWQLNEGDQGQFVGFGIERTDPLTDEVLFDWTSQTALDRGQLPSGAPNEDTFHANAVRWVPDDPGGAAYWISLAQLGNVVRLDPASGDITTRIGVGGDWTLDDPSDTVVGDGWFDFQHAIRVDMAADPPILRMHDNGLAYGRTRALDLALDLDHKVATVAWQYNEVDWQEYPGGDHDVLPGGHRLLTQGHCDCCRTTERESTISEIDPDTQEAVWRLRFASGDSWLYRSQRLDGCALFGNGKYCAE